MRSGRVPEPWLGTHMAHRSGHLKMGLAPLAEEGVWELLPQIFSAQSLGFLPDPVHHGQAPSQQHRLAFRPERSPPRRGCPGCGSGRERKLGLRL